MNETTASSTDPRGNDPLGDAQGPRVTWDEIRDVRRLSRPVHDRKVAGVAVGVARHLDIDPLLVRVAFVVLAFFGGCGVLLYGALWLLLPDDTGARARFGLDDRSRQFAVLGVLALGAMTLLGVSFGDWSFPWPLIVLGALALFFLSRSSDDGAPRDAGSYAAASTGARVASSSAYDAPAATAPYASTVHSSGDTTPSTGYMASTGSTPAAPVPPLRPLRTRPVDPRKRGPKLFWLTLALIALAFGVLGMLDVGGLDVVASAYPATALTITAAMLLLGAFWGRAGGLIALGLVALLATVASSAGERWDSDSTRVVPAEASAVADKHSFGVGEFVLDLREVENLDALDGRVLEVSGGAGRIEVVLPAHVGTSIDASVGLGSVTLLDGDEVSGPGVSTSGGHHAGDDVADVELKINLGVGEVFVSQDASTAPAPTAAQSTPTVPEGDAR